MADDRSAGVGYAVYPFSAEIRDEIHRLSESDNHHALLAWAEDVFWIALSIFAVLEVSWWLYPLAVLIVGARQRGLSTILHDCAHGCGASSRRLQMLIGTVLTAYPIFQRHYAYKASHVFTHHPLLGQEGVDPDFQFFIEQKAYTTVSKPRYLARVVLLPALGSRTLAYFRYLVQHRWRLLTRSGAGRVTGTRARRTADRLAFWGFWAATFAIALHFGFVLELLLFWFVPYVTSFHVLGWYIELSEHTPLCRDNQVDLYMTRNRRSRGLEKWLTGIHNDHHHLDHHLYPRTPFWKLPEARKIRLRDPSYRAIDEQTGGLFTKGPEGQPSALSTIVRTIVNEAAERAEDGAAGRAAPGVGETVAR
jgi:dihydrorhizobitoxine desaturase